MTIATAAAGNAAAAAGNVARISAETAARIRDCNDFMPTFVGNGATADMAHRYAECVNLVMPAQITGMHMLANVMAAAFIIVLVVSLMLALFSDAYATLGQIVGEFVVFSLVGCTGVVLSLAKALACYSYNE